MAEVDIDQQDDGQSTDARSKTFFRDDADRPFTPFERAQLRELLVADKRRVWVVSTIKTISAWVVGVAAAAAIMQDYIRKLFHGSTP